MKNSVPAILANVSPSRATTLALALLALSACSSLGLETEGKYVNKQKEELYKNGSVLSDDGGFNVFGGGADRKNQDGSGLGVNAFLWRASLDTIAFMPVSSVDPFGGVITTDWYSAPETPDERIKLNVFILDRDLRADGVRVSVFRQTRNREGDWSDAPVSATTANSLESAILTRARQMKLAQRSN